MHNSKIDPTRLDASAALEALHVAAAAINAMPRSKIKLATADNDHQSGEIIIEAAHGQGYVLRLEETQ